uniref:Gp5/Type VI secretion system Vgr protein OB-fold domain-containing protein n=1 Tax=viral metagenome TaxID=1070528 RepID=A0A6H1Z8M1_9ZZZZ
MGDDVIPGFAPAIVTKNVDPLGLGRVRFSIPGLIKESTQWARPMGWPGGSSVNSHGPQPRPPKIGSDICVMFAWGDYKDPEADVIFLSGFYGINPDGSSSGPTVNASASTPEEVTEICCLHEDETFQIYLKDHANEKKLVLQTKAGTKIEINGADGSGGKSETVTIEARTQISLYAKGHVDIRGSLVTIQGRTVSEFGGDL